MDGRERNNDWFSGQFTLAYPLTGRTSLSGNGSVYNQHTLVPAGKTDTTSLASQAAFQINTPFLGLTYVQGTGGVGKKIGTVQPYGVDVPEQVDVIYAKIGGKGQRPLGPHASLTPELTVYLNQSDQTFFGLYPSWEIGVTTTLQTGSVTSNLKAGYSGSRIRLNLDRDAETFSLNADATITADQGSLRLAAAPSYTRTSGYLPSEQLKVTGSLNATYTVPQIPGLTASLDATATFVTASADGDQLDTQDIQALLNLTYRKPIK